jgi:hypothetical protein
MRGYQLAALSQNRSSAMNDKITNIHDRDDASLVCAWCDVYSSVDMQSAILEIDLSPSQATKLLRPQSCR